MTRATISINNILWVTERWRGMDFSLYPDGNVKQGLLEKPATIDGYPICCEVAFYPSGKLKCGRLNETIDIFGVKYHEYIYLHENGMLQSSKLYENTVIEGQKFMGRFYIDFDDQGRVIGGVANDPGNKGDYVVKANIRKNKSGEWEKVKMDSEFFSEEKHNRGASVDNFEVASWENGPFGGNGSACCLRDFLQGTLNEVVAGDFPEFFDNIYQLAQAKHNLTTDIRPEIKLIL